MNLIKKVYSILISIIALIIALLLKIINLIHLISFFSVVQIIAFIPGKLGIMARRFWYKISLKKCGKNFYPEFGSMITYKESEIGNNVYVGSFSQIDLANISDDVMIAYDVIISGKKHAHGINKNNLMRLQIGYINKVNIEKDVWIGTRATIFEDVSKGTMIATSSFVNKKFSPYSILAGTPAKVIGKRK